MEQSFSSPSAQIIHEGGQEDEACMMHNGDKLGAAAAGKLKRSRQGSIASPCEPSRELIVRAQKIAFFNDSHRSKLS
jgi:hypothetical protein